MIYDEIASAAVRSIKMPVDMTVDIVDLGKYIGIRFYESEWAHLSEAERYRMGIYFEAVRKTLAALNIPATLDPVYDTPGIQKI